MSEDEVWNGRMVARESDIGIDAGDTFSMLEGPSPRLKGPKEDQVCEILIGSAERVDRTLKERWDGCWDGGCGLKHHPTLLSYH